MALQHTPDLRFFQALLLNGEPEVFSFGEYLAWREHNGVPLPEKEWTDILKWLAAHNNNYGRIGCWISIREFRKEFPDNPAVRKFREQHD